MHGDGIVSFIILLKVECDGDSVCLGEVGVVVVELFVAFEEADVPEFKEVGASFAGGAEALAGAHGKEEGACG